MGSEYTWPLILHGHSATKPHVIQPVLQRFCLGRLNRCSSCHVDIHSRRVCGKAELRSSTCRPAAEGSSRVSSGRCVIIVTVRFDLLLTRGVHSQNHSRMVDIVRTIFFFVGIGMALAPHLNFTRGRGGYLCYFGLTVVARREVAPSPKSVSKGMFSPITGARCRYLGLQCWVWQHSTKVLANCGHSYTIWPNGETMPRASVHRGRTCSV